MSAGLCGVIYTPDPRPSQNHTHSSPSPSSERPIRDSLHVTWLLLSSCFYGLLWFYCFGFKLESVFKKALNQLLPDLWRFSCSLNKDRLCCNEWDCPAGGAVHLRNMNLSSSTASVCLWVSIKLWNHFLSCFCRRCLINQSALWSQSLCFFHVNNSRSGRSILKLIISQNMLITD